MKFKNILPIIFPVLLSACGSGSSGGGSSYDFTAAAEAVFTDTARALRVFADSMNGSLGTADLMGLFTKGFASIKTPVSARAVSCNSTVCMDATAVEGKYYGVGLLIQSNNNGLSAYFGIEAWSDIVGTSDKYDFDIASPITNSGNLFCCNGEGDLANGSSYISNVSMMLAYADVTFSYTGSGGGAVDGAHTVRFVFADDAITDGQRGDLLYNDAGTYKWVDSRDGSLDVARPATPVQMDSAVTDWTNESEKGNQNIPVIYTGVLPAVGTDPIVVSEDDMRADANYSFKFPTEKLVIFPTLIDGSDEGMVTDVKTLLQRIHLQGMPHSTATLGDAGDTILTITAL